jgi:hypothetical protein
MNSTVIVERARPAPPARRTGRVPGAAEPLREVP